MARQQNPPATGGAGGVGCGARMRTEFADDSSEFF